MSASALGMVTVDGLGAARERGRQQLRAWLSDGTLLSAAAFAERLDTTSQALLHAESIGALFSIDVDGTPTYPAALAGMRPHEMAAVCLALGHQERARKLIFVLCKHGSMEGRTALQAVADGDLARVLELARAWRECE